MNGNNDYGENKRVQNDVDEDDDDDEDLEWTDPLNQKKYDDVRDKNMVKKVMRRIKYLLHHGQGIRKYDLLLWAKRNGITPSIVNEVLKRTNSYIDNRHYQLSYKNKRGYCPVRNSFLSEIQSDFAYFNKSDPSSKKGFVVFIDLCSRRIWAYHLRNRTVNSFLYVYKKFLKDYEGDVELKVSSIATDQEKALTTVKFITYIRNTRKINFIFFKTSFSAKLKAFMAELAIRNIRRLYGQLHVSDEKKYPTLSRSLNTIVDTLNNRKIIIGGRELPFTPKTVTKQNVDEFIEYVHNVSPSSYFSNFEIDDSNYIYSHPVGTYVRIKLIALQAQFVFGKRSEKSLSQRIYNVKRNFLFVR